MEIKTIRDLEWKSNDDDIMRIDSEILIEESMKRCFYYNVKMKRAKRFHDNKNYWYFKGMIDAEIFAHNLNKEDVFEQLISPKA